MLHGIFKAVCVWFLVRSSWLIDRLFEFSLHSLVFLNLSPIIRGILNLLANPSSPEKLVDWLFPWNSAFEWEQGNLFANTFYTGKTCVGFSLEFYHVWMRVGHLLLRLCTAFEWELYNLFAKLSMSAEYRKTLIFSTILLHIAENVGLTRPIKP